jgi:hypothetical protein
MSCSTQKLKKELKIERIDWYNIKKNINKMLKKKIQKELGFKIELCPK